MTALLFMGALILGTISCGITIGCVLGMIVALVDRASCINGVEPFFGFLKEVPYAVYFVVLCVYLGSKL